MAICPTCLTKYPDSVGTCSVDGVGLVPEDTFAHVDKELGPGDVVGEYRIEGKLGEGGFGAVFRAVHPVIGKHAAIKVLSRQFSANPQMVSRFIHEARAVNQIRHRNIIDIFAFGQLADGRQYYVMELLVGATFDSYLASHARLTLGQALPILRGIARALDAAHAKDILHRDLKPENVYLVFDEDGGVQSKLLDFGLVKLLGEGAGAGEHKTKTGTPMGTPYYMSPEQCRGKDVDRGTDIYAFGALVFQVLTGEVPFEGGSPMDVLLKHMTEEPPHASKRCVGVPAELDGPIRRMLAKEPSARPASVGEALDLLIAAGNAAGVLAGTAPLPPPNQHDTAREPYHAAATVPAMGTSNVEAAVRVVSGSEEVSPSGSTFVASEADVPPVRRSRARFGAALAVVMLATVVAGGTLWFSVKPDSRASATGIVASETTSAPLARSRNAPSAPPAPSAADPALSKSADVEIRIEGAPRDAKVMAGDRDLGVAPGPFAMKAGAPVALTVVAKGYKPRELVLTPTSNTTMTVTLDKQGGPGRVGAGAKGQSGQAGPAVSPDLEGFDKK